LEVLGFLPEIGQSPSNLQTVPHYFKKLAEDIYRTNHERLSHAVQDHSR